MDGTLKFKGQSSKQFRLGIVGGTTMIIRDDQTKKVLHEVPLFLTSVHYSRCERSEGSLIGLRTTWKEKEEPSFGRRQSAPPAPQIPGSASAAPSRHRRMVAAATREPAWLMVNEGGQDALHRALTLLAAGGALRHDLEQAYSVDNSVLGVGGFGTVKLARATHGQDKDGKEQVVLKFVAPDVPLAKQISPGQVRQAVSQATFNSDNLCSPEPAQRFPKVLRAEFEFLLNARGHPHIVALHGVFQNGDNGWALVMDYCAGGDLFVLVMKVGTLPEAALKALMQGLLDALVHIHKLDILHRDVKPENLLLHVGGRPVLADFGLACRADDGEETRRRIGSPGFIAPEVLKGCRCTNKADIFGAGVTCHFAMTGAAPFTGKDMASTLRKTVVDEVSYDDVDIVNKLSQPCKALVLTLMMKVPEDRPSAAEAYHSAWLEGRSVAGQQDTPRQPKSSRSLPWRPVTPQGNPQRRPWSGRIFVKAPEAAAGESMFIAGKGTEASNATASKASQPISARRGSRVDVVSHGAVSRSPRPKTPLFFDASQSQGQGERGKTDRRIASFTSGFSCLYCI